MSRSIQVFDERVCSVYRKVRLKWHCCLFTTRPVTLDEEQRWSRTIAKNLLPTNCPENFTATDSRLTVVLVGDVMTEFRTERVKSLPLDSPTNDHLLF